MNFLNFRWNWFGTHFLIEIFFHSFSCCHDFWIRGVLQQVITDGYCQRSIEFDALANFFEFLHGVTFNQLLPACLCLLYNFRFWLFFTNFLKFFILAFGSLRNNFWKFLTHYIVLGEMIDPLLVHTVLEFLDSTHLQRIYALKLYSNMILYLIHSVLKFNLFNK